jgi:hypothetical protein
MMVVALPELLFVQVVTAMIGQMEDGALKAPTVEMAQPEPLAVLAAASMMGQTEAGTFEAFVENMVTGQVSMPAPSSPTTTGRTVLKEALLQEGLASLGVGAGASQALVWASGDLHVREGPLLRWVDR